ncbi:MAG TPA: SCO family protein [Acidimicrobiales bacterium]|nr:SCO family protein [Acidimicrobiales bacterium]
MGVDERTSVAPGATDPAASVRARQTWRNALILGVAAIVTMGALDLAVVLSRSSGPHVDSLSMLMGLGDLPATKAAPDFTLVDQHGRTQSLSAMRGKAVVLQFMDPHCTDICPIVSQELVDAAHDLGRDVSKVDFVAVNVNPYATAVRDVSAFSREHGLSSLPNWYFVTGPATALAKVWSAYGISVEAPSPTADVIHSSYLFFIGKQGTERYMAIASDDHTTRGRAYLPAADVTAWGAGIATVVRRLL